MLEDKGGTNINSIIGIVLIFLILIAGSYFNRPSPEQIQAAKDKQDSAVTAQIAIAAEQEKRAAEAAQIEVEGAVSTTPEIGLPLSPSPDSTKTYGLFEKAKYGEEKFYFMENEHLKITISSKGGMIRDVELKNYQTHDSLPLHLPSPEHFLQIQ